MKFRFAGMFIASRNRLPAQDQKTAKITGIDIRADALPRHVLAVPGAEKRRDRGAYPGCARSRRRTHTSRNGLYRPGSGKQASIISKWA